MEHNTDTNLVSQYALQVALQTMKERVVALQRRLTSLEEENQQLRERKDEDGSTQMTHSSVGGGAAENFQLRIQVAELQRQKSQLTEHINMVSNENRKLWSRLSQMAKEQDKTKADNNTLTNTEEAVKDASTRGIANQNLIRSKTFTQHSPNPHLRHKMISSDDVGVDELRDISLEEVALSAYESKITDVDEEYAKAADAELGFAYLNVDETVAEAEFNLEAKKCIEGLKEIRNEAMKQQQNLNSALIVLENRNALQPCAECLQKSQKPEMADKSLETDESLNELTLYNDNQIMRESTLKGHNNVEPAEASTSHINMIQEKTKADANDKTCPMCGKVFSVAVTFDAFRQHVEMHFIDECSDVDNSLERNYEFISHAVGDF